MSAFAFSCLLPKVLLKIAVTKKIDSRSSRRHILNNVRAQVCIRIIRPKGHGTHQIGPSHPSNIQRITCVEMFISIDDETFFAFDQFLIICGTDGEAVWIGDVVVTSCLTQTSPYHQQDLVRTETRRTVNLRMGFCNPRYKLLGVHW